MQQQIERLEGDIARYMEEIQRLTEENAKQTSELEDASALLKDRWGPGVDGAMMDLKGNPIR